MPVVDPIADMLARIRNAQMALHKDCQIPKSKMKLALAQILQDEGYIDSYEERDRDILIRLKRVGSRYAITGMRRVSRPGCRRYVGMGEIPQVQNGLGINVLSTSHGVLEGNQAQEHNVGGELLCQIW
jgi:small subunit ribosomal protein S8